MPEVKKSYEVKRVKALEAERDFFGSQLGGKGNLVLMPRKVKQGKKTKVRIVGHQLKERTSSRRRSPVIETNYPLKESQVTIKVLNEKFLQQAEQLVVLIEETGLKVKLAN